MAKTGRYHADKIGFFIIREQQGTAELEIQDTEAMSTREEAMQWISEHGLTGVDYWVCAPVGRTSFQA